MKKNNKKTSKGTDCCGGDVINEIKKQVEDKMKGAKKYAKDNPKETKTALAGIGAFLVVVIAFLFGKSRRKK